jgi:HPt (histidine-containing phosphotransfer) domain-containing protein/two-component sensor histidine kinase
VKSFSIRRLRNIILLCLVLALGAYTAVMFSLSRQLSERFGPQVRADLEWRAMRGAQELARSADIGLAVSDRDMVVASFGVYTRSDDVRSIVAVDADGVVVAQHGVAPDQVTALFEGPSGALRGGEDYLVSWAPAEIEGQKVGKVAIAVSAHRLHQADALLARSSTTVLVGGLAALVLGALVVVFFTRAVETRDAQLSDYTANLEKKVEERTRELDERNRGMRMVLDNVAQGFITTGIDGVMAAERSAVVDRWFGVAPPGLTLSELLREQSPHYATWFELGLEQLRDGLLPTELVLEQMPLRFTAGERTFEVNHTPIGASEQVERLLVIISDVTERLAHERAEREQRELVALFQRISIDRGGVEEFLLEAGNLVASLREATDPVVQSRLVHTLKGNCAIYGLTSYAELAHRVESEMVESGAGLTAEQRHSLVELWREAMGRVAALLGGARSELVEIERGELDAAIARAGAGGGRDLAAVLSSWTREPVARRFERLARQADALCRRLGRPPLDVKIHSDGVRLDSAGWSSFWAAMVHVIRNAVDHGIEDPDTRVAAGKSEAGALELYARSNDGQLVIGVRDDGRGIDWERVRTRARQLEIPYASESDLVEALFADGLTTRDQAGDLSGRGVGLSALRQIVHELGGAIAVTSRTGGGTLFELTFEERRATATAGVWARRARSSLVPAFI